MPKLKTSRSAAKRFKFSKTGKVKRHHCFTSHLMSSRPANKRRQLRGSAVLFEGHARNMREMMGLRGLHPNKIAHERALAAKQANKTDEPAKAETK